MKYLIVGLGNPTAEYEQTRHNAGYIIADNFVKDMNLENSNTYKFSLERHAFICKTKVKGREIVVAKPVTYMNLSGKAVNYWLAKEKIPLENMLVIVDDIALETGTIRLRMSGSDGGHNGLFNIIETLNTNKFNRLRFGIGNHFSKGHQIDYVLGRFSTEELDIINPKLSLCTDIIKSFCTIGMDRTMNIFNGK
ncbi:MAG: aminoacyl-tRNA hydrolase [Bacteroidales bacterium]|jgi:PTH1 family peptidyl-tRNA hydrolase|nr:aminoacyl-tRNA hydrolase [Bacteroidales bacterium]